MLALPLILVYIAIYLTFRSVVGSYHTLNTYVGMARRWYAEQAYSWVGQPKPLHIRHDDTYQQCWCTLADD
jgi:hypothetical protein